MQKLAIILGQCIYLEFLFREHFSWCVYFFFFLISKCLNECEENMAQASKISKTYEELLTDLSGFLDIDIREKEKPQEYLTSKVIV